MRVLFIEDDVMNRRVVRDMLQVAGADMAEAEDGVTGLAAVEAGNYDLLLVDLRMPGMDGLAAIARIRARADSKAGVPIIVVTADTAANLRDSCLGAGADEVILKPVAMTQLFTAMGRVMVEAGRRNEASRAA